MFTTISKNLIKDTIDSCFDVEITSLVRVEIAEAHWLLVIGKNSYLGENNNMKLLFLRVLKTELGEKFGKIIF